MILQLFYFIKHQMFKLRWRNIFKYKFCNPRPCKLPRNWWSSYGNKAKIWRGFSFKWWYATNSSWRVKKFDLDATIVMSVLELQSADGYGRVIIENGNVKK